MDYTNVTLTKRSLVETYISLKNFTSTYMIQDSKISYSISKILSIFNQENKIFEDKKEEIILANGGNKNPSGEGFNFFEKEKLDRLIKLEKVKESSMSDKDKEFKEKAIEKMVEKRDKANKEYLDYINDNTKITLSIPQVTIEELISKNVLLRQKDENGKIIYENQAFPVEFFQFTEEIFKEEKEFKNDKKKR